MCVYLKDRTERMFFIVDDHGTPLGKFKTREAADAALEELHDSDPLSVDECGIVEIDDKTGRRVDAPIGTAAAPP